MTTSFAQVLGQEETVGHLRREAALGRLAHSYLLEGPTGGGKLTLARSFAAFLLCDTPADGDACGVCHSCRLFEHGNHPDYLELPREPAELRIGRFVERTAGETLDHQPLLPFLRFRPVEGGRRLAVIPDAERMRPEAANAFLKTLEEPPGDAVVILTVNSRDRLPATIVSRCRRVGMRPLPPDRIAGELVKRGVATEAAAPDLAEAAEGSLGTALALAGDETLALWRWLEDEAFIAPGPATARRLADNLLAYGGVSGDNAGKRQSAIAALDLTALALRRRLRAGLNPDKAETALAVLWDAGDRIVRNVRPELVMLSAAFDIMAALR